MTLQGDAVKGHKISRSRAVSPVQRQSACAVLGLLGVDRVPGAARK